MAVNLRLTAETAAALQAEAERTGRSQQEILREAVNRHLHLVDDGAADRTDRSTAIAERQVRRAKVPYRKVTPRIRLPRGTDSLDLLDREDRI